MWGMVANPNKAAFPSEYQTWKGIRKRCRNERCRDFKNYGARGISVCSRWESFNTFLEDMGPRPTGLTLERKDNSLGYSPENCVWATRAEQNINKRNVMILEVNGHRIPRVVLEQKLGFSRRRIDDRLRKGWSLEKAISTPQRKSPKKST